MKTKLDRSIFREALEKMVELKRRSSGIHVGLYAWEGCNPDGIQEDIREFARKHPEDFNHLPLAIYASQRFLLLLNQDGRRDNHAYNLLQLSPDGAREGMALLAFVHAMWNWSNEPNWLADAAARAVSTSSPMHWPSDVLESILRQ